jgi:hypothetical protein
MLRLYNMLRHHQHRLGDAHGSQSEKSASRHEYYKVKCGRCLTKELELKSRYQQIFQEASVDVISTSVLRMVRAASQ